MKILNLNTSLKIIGSTVFLLGLLNLIGTNLLSTKGQELEKLNSAALSLQKDNSYLKSQIAGEMSLAKVETKALAQGFVKISSPLALTPPAPVAYLPRSVKLE